MNNGWIKLHRKIIDSSLYKNLNSKQRDVLITCLLLANHDSNEWQWNGKIHKCDPGEFITSLQSLSEKCGNDVKVQSVRTALLKLEKWHFLTNTSTKDGRLIKIVNWVKYQILDSAINKESNKELTKHQQRANKELTTNKNDKNDKKYIYIKDLTDEVLEEIATAYSISIKSVKDKKESMHLWMEEQPSRYLLKGRRRNLKMSLMNWLRKDIKKGEIKKIVKSQAINNLPNISEEQRKENLLRLQEMKSQIGGLRT